MTRVHDEPHVYGEGTGLALLMAGFLLGPLAWFLDLQISYALVKWACRHDQRAVLLAIPAGSFLLAGTAVWLSWSSLAALRGRARPDGGRREDRNLFLAAAGLVTSSVFALLILIAIVPRLVLSPCE